MFILFIEPQDAYQPVAFNHIDSPQTSPPPSVSSNDSEASDSEGADPGSDSEREFSSEEDEENEDLNNHPLYDGARVTVGESLLLVLTFILSHRLTGLCLSDLLSLIEIHCAPNNRCVKTLYMFKKHFEMFGRDLIICHFYCSVCEIALESKLSVCDTCQGHNDVAYFIEFPILAQLQCMFKRPGFFQSLMFRFNREKKNVNNIEDIYDGSIYQQSVDNGFLANRNNFSFFMYFDGISLFKSSTFSIWPVYLTINELKYKLRTQKENTVLAGIWFGKTKPNPNLFLGPLHNTLSVLENDGANVTLPCGENVLVKFKLLGVVADMPAKSTFMRLRQFNGAYSCFNCMEKGGRYDLGNSTVQVFPYNRNYQLRDNAEMVEYGRLAFEARLNDPDSSVYGVKGPTLLSIMLPNFVSCMAIDIMHGAFLGVMKTVAGLWFHTEHAGSPFSISDFVQVVDERLKSIKPPLSFQRLSRSLYKEFAQMKASDWKIFFFFYSLPVLNGILPQPYWLHHCKLVMAIAVLCQESISIEEIDAADDLLHSYVEQFQELYGLRYMSLTFHQLLHLGLVVKNLGPSWVYSCFFYESLNGELARLVHGSRYVALQICSSSSVFMNLTVMISTMPDGAAKDLCLKFKKRGTTQVKICENIDHQTDVVGKMVKCFPVPELITGLLRDSFNLVGGMCKYFYRLKRKKVVATNTIHAFPVESIKSVCLFMSVDGNEYMALPINNLEVE
ncbi:hypothetical protein ONE63_003500 [Megalurothrips usitatus]|uniref:Uncharacterized protein n=1 Tax=Megalurothrips usitatus TaxID=439358 RepID=A0AAV7XA40_9NEOP|nr:hypothetical protein ONE63_003500 [Megalurothrips usitatus]